MEKSKFLFGALGVLALGFTACTSDDSLNEPQVAQKDEVRYMHVTIASPQVSRAGKFEDGTTAENTVKNIYFKFFDRNGRFVANSEIETTGTNTVTGFVDPDPADPNIAKIKEAVVKVNLSEGSGYPAYVLCFVNPFDWGDIRSTDLGLDDFNHRTRETYRQGSSAPYYFSMNNSVYYGKDAVSGADNVKIAATPIVYDQLFTTAAEAADATGEGVVNIYVERYAAKVQFTLETEVGEDGTGGIQPVTVGEYTLTFNPEAWTINADAPNMYVIKRYDTENATSTDIPTLGEVNAMLEGWTTWNDPTNHRSYWACSPGFYAKNFPEVSDQIADYYDQTEGLTGTGAGQVQFITNAEGVRVTDPASPNALKYYSYNNIMNGTQNTGTGYGIKTWAAATDGTLPCKYVLENTMGKDAFDSKNPKAAAPSLLLVGNYQITGQPANTTFYLMDDDLYLQDEITDAFLGQNSVLYIGANVGAENETFTQLSEKNASATIKNAISVMHPAYEVRGTQAVPHRLVTLQLTSALDNLYYSPFGTSEMIQVTAANLTQVNTILWNQLGTAEAYTNGKCYFSIPIKHLAWTEREGADPNAAINWDNTLVGDFGLVRNHVYTINVEEIKGTASGILDLNYPIVPPADIDSYYVKYRLNILNWRVVPEQNVKL